MARTWANRRADMSAAARPRPWLEGPPRIVQVRAAQSLERALDDRLWALPANRMWRGIT